MQYPNQRSSMSCNQRFNEPQSIEPWCKLIRRSSRIVITFAGMGILLRIKHQTHQLKFKIACSYCKVKLKTNNQSSVKLSVFNFSKNPKINAQERTHVKLFNTPGNPYFVPQVSPLSTHFYGLKWTPQKYVIIRGLAHHHVTTPQGTEESLVN